MTLDQAKALINELGYARLTEQRARPLHRDEPVPKKPREVRLPRAWRGREVVLHAKLNDAVIPVLTAALGEVASPGGRDEIKLMIRFAKQVKCRLKPVREQTAAQENAA